MDPVAAEVWLEAVETTFIYMKCPPKYQVHCGTYMRRVKPIFCGKVHRGPLHQREVIFPGISSRKPTCISITQ